ncbi:MAG: diaminopimelate epimerase [Bdellovibrionales bacterium]
MMKKFLSEQLPFYKMHGLGNDFVVIDGRENGFMPDKEFCLSVANRHRGVGYDQLIILAQPQSEDTDLFIHFFNADGSVAGACGNGTRCVARLFFENTGKKTSVFETIAGKLSVWREGDIYAVDFGEPRLKWDQIPLSSDVDTLNVNLDMEGLPSACCVNMGNPHAVFFVEDVSKIDVAHYGALVERHAAFPERTNVEFAQVVAPDLIRMRVFERGTGITEACGSGACATLVAAVRHEKADETATIRLDGGDLIVTWRKQDQHVILRGPASLSYQGVLGPDL